MAAAQFKTPITFNGVGSDGTNAGVGVKLDRENINLDEADEFFGNKRIKARIALGKPPAQGQAMAFEVDLAVDAMFDVHQFSATDKSITTRFYSPVAGVDMSVLAKFAKRHGQLEIYQVESMATAAEDDGEADGEGDDGEQAEE